MNMSSIKELLKCFYLLATPCLLPCGDAAASRVFELSDRFIDVRHEGQWLVMFYAPGCGYCKRTEPVFALVAQALHATNVRVGRLDCTKYPAAAVNLKYVPIPLLCL
ncbi:hypothetical protein DOY81_013930 [Sarcophaga bullata]|nr:hypothetical protein DOY81_013930 [Sarcophaga bullata]